MHCTRHIAGAGTALAIIGLCAPILAHTDDPKAGTIVPKDGGAVWRRAVEGAAPGGMAMAGEFESLGVNLESLFPLDAFEGDPPEATDIWGYTSPSGREYALISLYCGLGFVEVTDPANAQVIDTISGACSGWGDVKTYGHFAYRVTEDDSIGIQVINLEAIDAGIVFEYARVDSGNGTGASHNIVIDEESGYLYRVGGSFYGFGAYDLNEDPGRPMYVGSWSDRYVHDAQVVTHTDGPYEGRQYMFACSGDNGGWSNGRLEIIDVTFKNAMHPISEAYYENAVYSHQGWLSEDRRYFYLNDELDEQELGSPTTTRVFLVANPHLPLFLTTFTNGLETIDHNLFVRGNYIFAANYTSGLRVFDRTDPLAPVEIGFFDTRPESDSTTFLGLWGNYPFFPSGTVIGSDRSRGLFVWSIDALNQPCPDADGDGEVGFSDVLLILATWGEQGGPADVDGDGEVGFGDVLRVLAEWGAVCPG